MRRSRVEGWRRRRVEGWKVGGFAALKVGAGGADMGYGIYARKRAGYGEEHRKTKGRKLNPAVPAGD